MRTLLQKPGSLASSSSLHMCFYKYSQDGGDGQGKHVPHIRRRLTMGVGRSRRIVSTITSTHSSHGRRKERKGGREHVLRYRASARIERSYIERAIVCNALKRIRRCCYRGREGNKKARRDGNLGRIYTFPPSYLLLFCGSVPSIQELGISILARSRQSAPPSATILHSKLSI